MDGMDWIHLILDKEKWWPLINMVINIQLPLNAWHVLSISVSRRILLHGVTDCHAI
jgi:hypothetical protein